MADPTGDEELFRALCAGDRVALGKAITLVESTRRADRDRAVALVEQARSVQRTTLRIGITGIPGVGKSTLIDPIGREAIGHGHRVAVLATDPSSIRSGGSILGDKTRMDELSRSEHAFIRPTASRGNLGGVARRTQETILLCEAAGYDVILVETVGVGQSELEVDRMTDLNVLLTIPGTGDELQGIKRGVMESADVIVLTKADPKAATLYADARRSLLNAIAFLPARDSGKRPEVLLTEALSGDGIAALWAHIVSMSEGSHATGYFEKRRAQQNAQWLQHALRDGLLEELLTDPGIAAHLETLQASVRSGELGPFKAAAELIERFRTSGGRLP